MMSETADVKTRELKLVDCFTKSTWIALGLALLCLGMDAYAVLYMPLSLTSEQRRMFRPSNGFLISIWTVEAALALLACWLLHYAFSRPPRLPAGV